MDKVRKTYRLSSDVVARLDEIAIERGVSQTQVVEGALAEWLTNASDSMSDGMSDNSASVVAAMSEQIDDLRQQVGYMRSEIDSLQRLLDQSQQLQLATLNALPAGDDESDKKQKKTKRKK